MSSLKPFVPLLITFILPRAINYYRVLKTAIRIRPPPKKVSADTQRGLNVLFVSVCLFLYLTLSPVWDTNVFAATKSRLQIPTDVLFSRLALLRPGGILTPTDGVLRSKLTSAASRHLYLRFGPGTVANCSFCQPDDEISYLLYHLPTNVILPHLLHLTLLGFATSEGVSGFEARRWRKQSAIGALILAAADFYMVASYAPRIDPNIPAPLGIFWAARVLRHLAICLFDICLTLFLYGSATNHFLLFNTSAEADPQVMKRQQEQLLGSTNIALQMAQTRLRAFSVARNACVRQPVLKNADDEYWKTVIAMEGPTGSGSVWDDEEVQAAIARTLGSGTIDMDGVEREANAFVTGATRNLDMQR